MLLTLFRTGIEEYYRVKALIAPTKDGHPFYKKLICSSRGSHYYIHVLNDLSKFSLAL